MASVGKYQMMMALMLFNMFLFPLIATSIAIPNVPNPLVDLFPGFGQGPSSAGAGTTSGSSDVCTQSNGITTCTSAPSSADNVRPGQLNIQSCLFGIGTGALIGGAAGLIIATPVTAIGGAILGGVAGCGITSTFFPSQGAAAFNAFANTAGPIGDFAKALAAALAWVGPVLKFFQDMVGYEFALLINAPEIGVFLFPLQAVTAVIFMFIGAEYIRGSGIGA